MVIFVDKMSRSANLLCEVCRARASIWRCACSAFPLCNNSCCTGTHLASTPDTPHLLVPCGAEDFMPPEEAKNSLRACDVAVEVARFVEEERKWLLGRKEEIVGEIYKEVDRIYQGIMAMAEKAKEQTEVEINKALTTLDSFRSLERREHVAKVKSSKDHLVSLDFRIDHISFKPMFHFSLISSCEHTYTNAEPSRDWIFNGEDIDALTISVSKSIHLTGVILGAPKSAPSCTTELRKLEIHSGDSTQGPLLYKHPTALVLKQPVIRFTKPLPLLPEQKYTIKSLLAGDSITAGNSCRNRLQEGLEVKLFAARLGLEEASNGTNASEGIFSGFLYRL